MDSVTMFERAATNAASMLAQVQPDQRSNPTPCREWDVQALVDHMAAGSGYLLAAAGLNPSPSGTDEVSYRAAVARCVEELGRDGVLERSCRSPAGFEWPIRQAAAATAMDQLIHTWDLAVAIGADRRLDPELVDTVSMMFLPDMPELGRAAGLVGPAVVVPADASGQDRLLAAMGRHP
jgi:uncharacterized protein (TIGR03086 family)